MPVICYAAEQTPNSTTRSEKNEITEEHFTVQNIRNVGVNNSKDDYANHLYTFYEYAGEAAFLQT